MTRRQFITVGATLGATVVLGAGTGCSRPSAEEKNPVGTPTSSYGGDSAMKKILVGYATRTGSTVGVAEAVGESLGKRGFAVDVAPLKESPSLEGYDAVVLGSAVNGGAWLPEAVSFVEKNRTALATVPVALFCVHIMNMGDDEKSTRKRLAYLDPIRTMLEATDEGFFAGVGPTSKDSSLLARWALRAFGGGGEGDCRDWDEIRGWSEQLAV